MGCTLFPFRRCCARVRGMEKYAGLPGEAYPIIVNAFKVDNPYIPSPNKVPDAPDTGEMWLLGPTTPIRREMLWLTPNSIEVSGRWSDPCGVWPEWDDFQLVEAVNLFTTKEVLERGLDHPWLNRRGHILSSRDYDTIVWGQELHCLTDACPQTA